MHKSIKIQTILLFLIIGLTQITFTQQYYVKNESNSPDGFSAVYMVNNYITPHFQLSAGIVETISGDKIYILASYYSGYDRFGARKLHIFIDDAEITVDRIVNRRQQNNHEIVGFEISRDLLKKLGSARNIRMQVRGNWLIEQDIDQLHIRRFGDFYNQHTRY